MTLKQARNLKPGDKVKQNMFGYIMTVERVEECRVVINEFVNVICKTESGSIMKHKHKELLLMA
ncbi:hypothetical protein DW839_18405 [Enterocloster bolteae]|jgi:hypothetical protein|uniref:DUF2187 domain-containing protein n=1 Tax=Enterocloster bolteae TaxID=208479 RepID=A0A414AT44_9FIRM|nr:hypothetical protein DW839_18405 [Enterocloster bolteae]